MKKIILLILSFLALQGYAQDEVAANYHPYH